MRTEISTGRSKQRSASNAAANKPHHNHNFFCRLAQPGKLMMLGRPKHRSATRSSSAFESTVDAPQVAQGYSSINPIEWLHNCGKDHPCGYCLPVS